MIAYGSYPVISLAMLADCFFNIACRLRTGRLLVFSAQSRVPYEQTAERAKINEQAEQLLNDYGTNILRLAYSYLHNTSDAEEILQDTLIQFLKATPAFKNSEHEKAWLLRVASNLSKNKIAYNKRHSADELDETLVTEGHKELSFVWDAVKALPQNYRETIHLFYYEGYTSAQIARILHKNESSIRTDLRRGRAKLKETLKEVYDFDKKV